MVNHTYKVPFHSIPRTPPLFVDYLERGSASAKFFPHHFLDPNSFQEVSQRLQFDTPRREALVRALVRQNEQWGMQARTRENLEALAETKCFAVVTGQQVGLLTGPCYTAYKALSAIRLAQHLTERGIQCVPMFWMETEDHDLGEVDHVGLLDSSSQSLSSVRLTFEAGTEGRPVGKIVLEPGLAAFQEAVRKQLPVNSEFAEQTMALVGECYQEGRTIGDGFALMMEKLFGAHGLILVDPSDPALISLSPPIFEWVLQEFHVLRTRMSRTNEEIARSGFEPQIKLDSQSTLLFFFEDGIRRLLLDEGDHVMPKGSNRRMTLREAVGMAQSEPHKFSASVAVRPLLQDHLLPTIAYVGGPSESSYLAQLSGFYELFGRPMPVLVPRGSHTVLTEKAQKIMAKYELDFASVLKGEERLTAQVFERSVSAEAAAQFDMLRDELSIAFDRLKPLLEQADLTLIGALGTARQKVDYQLNHLKSKYLQAEKRRNETIVQQIAALENMLWPRKNLQERELNICYFLARYGRDYLRVVFEATEPLPTEHSVLCVET